MRRTRSFINNLKLNAMRTDKIILMHRSLYSGQLLLSKQILLFVLAGVLITVSSCKKSNDPNVIFKATINGASETPPNSSTATGTATLTYNKDTKIFNIIVNFTGITATISHIHKGAIGVPGGVIFGFPTPIVSPINYTSAVLDSTQNADLNLNLYYVNIHSAEFPAGEIRGQLIKQ
jgi:hypothetical protein